MFILFKSSLGTELLLSHWVASPVQNLSLERFRVCWHDIDWRDARKETRKVLKIRKRDVGTEPGGGRRGLNEPSTIASVTLWAVRHVPVHWPSRSPIQGIHRLQKEFVRTCYSFQLGESACTQMPRTPPSAPWSPPHYLDAGQTPLWPSLHQNPNWVLMVKHGCMVEDCECALSFKMVQRSDPP